MTSQFRTCCEFGVVILFLSLSVCPVLCSPNGYLEMYPNVEVNGESGNNWYPRPRQGQRVFFNYYYRSPAFPGWVWVRPNPVSELSNSEDRSESDHPTLEDEYSQSDQSEPEVELEPIREYSKKRRPGPESEIQISSRSTFSNDFGQISFPTERPAMRSPPRKNPSAGSIQFNSDFLLPKAGPCDITESKPSPTRKPVRPSSNRERPHSVNKNFYAYSRPHPRPPPNTGDEEESDEQLLQQFLIWVSRHAPLDERITLHPRLSTTPSPNKEMTTEYGLINGQVRRTCPAGEVFSQGKCRPAV